MQQKPDKSQGRRWPWAVVRSKRAYDPANPIRYQHTFKLAIAVLVSAVVLTVFTFPARTIEIDMRAEVEAAKLAGFPQLPPAFASDKRIGEFMRDWDILGQTSLVRVDVIAMSTVVGEYENDSSLVNSGIAFSLLAVTFISAVAFSRASNNLYALGYDHSPIPPAWAFVSWFVPPLSFFLPWQVVSGVFNPVKSDDEGNTISESSMMPRVIAGIWGLAFIGLWVLNPISLQWFAPRGDIDGWLSTIDWTDRMMIWLPITSFINVAILLTVTIGQHRRYRALDQMQGR